MRHIQLYTHRRCLLAGSVHCSPSWDLLMITDIEYDVHWGIPPQQKSQLLVLSQTFLTDSPPSHKRALSIPEVQPSRKKGATISTPLDLHKLMRAKIPQPLSLLLKASLLSWRPALFPPASLRSELFGCLLFHSLCCWWLRTRQVCACAGAERHAWFDQRQRSLYYCERGRGT